MKILLGSSRVAMKLLLKILLQCCLPVDGSCAGRAGGAQAARADGVGRAGAQRRAPTRVPAPTAGAQAAPPPQVRTPGQRGAGRAGDRKGFWGLLARRGICPRGNARRRRHRWQGCAHRRGEAQPGLQRRFCVPLPLFVSFFFFIFLLVYFEYTMLQKNKIQTTAKKNK